MNVKGTTSRGELLRACWTGFSQQWCVLGSPLTRRAMIALPPSGITGHPHITPAVAVKYVIVWLSNGAPEIKPDHRGTTARRSSDEPSVNGYDIQNVYLWRCGGAQRNLRNMCTSFQYHLDVKYQILSKLVTWTRPQTTSAVPFSWRENNPYYQKNTTKHKL